MWTRPVRTGGDPASTSWPRALARLRCAAPWSFWAAATELYLMSLGAGLAITPPHSTYALIDPAPGIAALWMATHLPVPAWWRERAAWATATTVLGGATGAALIRGLSWHAALVQAGGTLVAALATALLWRHVPRRASLGAVAGIWRLVVVCALGAVPAMLALPPLAGTHPSFGPAALGLAWYARAATGLLVPLLLGDALLASRSSDLRRAPLATLAPLLGGTLAVGTVSLVADQRPYLLIPLVVWAASTLTVRGTAAYVVLVLGLALQSAPTGTGPLAVGGFVDRTLTANIFVMVVAGIGMTLARAREERAALLGQITARSREAVEQSDLFATVLAATQDAVLTLDADRGVVLANAASRALAVHCGTTVDGLVAQADPAGFEAVLGAGEASVADMTVVPAQGGPERVLAVRAYPMRHLDRAGAVVFLQDVTADRRRTEGLRYFARTVAHDLRNPLTGIQLSSEMAASALDVGDTAEAAAMVAAVAASGDRATRLLRDVADFSLAGDGELRTEPVHLDDFVARIARQQAADAGSSAGAGVDTLGGSEPLDLRVDADVCVQVDARLLARVVENLLGNATKYCAPGSAPSVDVVAYDRGDGRATVLVQDRGIGIPAGQERRIFEAFHRVPEHASGYAGTGLGLAICRQVVERHGGTIVAEPRRGGGTTFRFTLPLAAEVPLRVAV